MEFGLEPQHLSALGDTEEFEKPDFSDFEPTAAFPAVVDAPVAPAPPKMPLWFKLAFFAFLCLLPLLGFAGYATLTMIGIIFFAIWASHHPKAAVLVVGGVVATGLVAHHVMKSVDGVPDYGGNLDLTK